MEKQKSYGIIEWVMKMKSFNYEEMFAQSIGLQEPWRVERVEYDEEEERIWRHGDVCFFSMLCSLPETKDQMRKQIPCGHSTVGKKRK